MEQLSRSTMNAALPPIDGYTTALKFAFGAIPLGLCLLPAIYSSGTLGDWTGYIAFWRRVPGIDAVAASSRFPQAAVVGISSCVLAALLFAFASIPSLPVMRRRLRAKGIRLMKPWMGVACVSLAALPFLLGGMSSPSDAQFSQPLSRAVSESLLALGLLSAATFVALSSVLVVCALSFLSMEST